MGRKASLQGKGEEASPPGRGERLYEASLRSIPSRQGREGSEEASLPGRGKEATLQGMGERQLHKAGAMGNAIRQGREASLAGSEEASVQGLGDGQSYLAGARDNSTK